MFSIIIPCRNETEIIEETVKILCEELKEFKLEIIIINDFSNDDTLDKIRKLEKNYSFLKSFNNNKEGLGGAINLGIQSSSGEYILIYMADMSDDIKDVKKYFTLCLNEKNLDAVFGSRFSKTSKVQDYPKKKLILNRIFNYIVKILFFSEYNDFTNAFKIYKKKTLIEISPIISENFNIFLEIPLKIISRNYKYKIIPINWNNRKKGVAKFKMKELGSMYLFTLLYCLIEKILLNKKIKY